MFLIRKSDLNVGCLWDDRVVTPRIRRDGYRHVSAGSWLIENAFYRSTILLLALVGIKRQSWEYEIDEDVLRRFIQNTVKDLLTTPERTNMFSGHPFRTHCEHWVWKWNYLQHDNIHTDSTTTSEAARIVCEVTIVVGSLGIGAQKPTGTVVRPTSKLDIGMAPYRLFRRVSVLRGASWWT